MEHHSMISCHVHHPHPSLHQHMIKIVLASVALHALRSWWLFLSSSSAVPLLMEVVNPSFWETNLWDHFRFPCHMGSHITSLSLRVDLDCCIFQVPVSKQWYGCQCFGFLTWAPMHKGAVAWMNIGRESVLKVDSGRKIPCRKYQGVEPALAAQCAWCSTNWATSPPQLSYKLQYPWPLPCPR